MNLFKKVIATVAMTTLVATATMSSTSAYVASSTEAANTLAEQGVIVAHENVADYKLSSNILRQEVAAMAFSIAKLTKKATCENEYSDVTATTPNTWACYVVEALRDNGYLAHNAKFNPEANITKAEALGMVVSAAFAGEYKYDASKGTSWQEQLVNFAVNNEILPAAFTDYNTAATRGEVFKWTVNAIDAAAGDELGGLDDLLGDLDEGEADESDDTTDDTATTTPVLTGDLTVEANPETPAGADLPRGADGVLVLKLDLTAGNEDTSVTELDFERLGFGEDAADEISLFANGTRLTKSKAFNSDDEANVSVNPALVVKAGETITVDVRVDTALKTDKDGNPVIGEFAIKLTGVTASANVEASEIVSNTFDVKLQDATKLVVKDGSVNTEVTAGELDADVAEFDLENDGNVSNSDITVSSITLKETGTVDQEEDLANFKLIHDGKVVATVDSMAGKYLTFNLDTPVVIEDDKTETFKVTADIMGGADDKIKFELDAAGDIVATASKYNAVNVDDQLTGTEITINAGELTIYSIDAENDTVRDDSDDVILGQLKVVNVAGENLNIKNLGVEITTEDKNGVALNPEDVLDNVKAEINGTSYDLYQDDNNIKLFNDTDLDITLPQGTTIVTIYADTEDDLADGTTIEMKLVVNDAELYVEESDDDTQVTDVTPSSLTWDKIEVKQPAVTVSGTPLADVAVVKGSSDLVALQFEVEANEVSDLTVDEVNFTVAYNGGYGTDVNDYITEVKLYKGSVSETNKLDSLSSTKLADGTNQATGRFDGFETTIAADATETFVVVVSTANTDDAINGVVTVSLTDLSVEDDDNNNVDVTASVTGKNVTIKDSGSLKMIADANNSDNEDPKTILAGMGEDVFSVDVIATNEDVEVETVKFTLSENVKEVVSSAELYLGNTKVADALSADVTDADNSVITFDNISNLVVPTSSEELKLVVNTYNIGFEKVGLTQTGITVTKVEMDDAKGAESNEDVTVDDLTTTASNTFDVVPVTIDPSVVAQFDNNGEAKVKVSVDAGDNKAKDENTSPKAVITKLVFTELGNSGEGADAYSVYKDGDSDNKVSCANDGTTVTCTVSVTVSDTETFVIKANATKDKTYALNLHKDGVVYTTNVATDDNNNGSVEFKSNLSEEQSLGSKTY